MEDRWKLGAGAGMGLLWFFPTPKEAIHSANVNPDCASWPLGLTQQLQLNQQALGDFAKSPRSAGITSKVRICRES